MRNLLKDRGSHRQTSCLLPEEYHKVDPSQLMSRPQSFKLLKLLKVYLSTGSGNMSSTWFGEVYSAWPTNEARSYILTEMIDTKSLVPFPWSSVLFPLATRVRYYRCGAPVKHRCKCFTVSPVQNYFTGVLIFAVNGAFSYKT